MFCLRTPRLAVCAAAAAILAGCATRQSVVLRSVSTGATLVPGPTRAVYTAADPNTADIYITDLPREDLEVGAPLEGVSGEIIHIRMFVNAEAGRTPINTTACTATIRVAVIAGGQAGVYGGGGFLFSETNSPGGSEYTGSVRDATMRLLGSTDGFADRLGASDFDATFIATRDNGLARVIARRLDDVLDRVSAAAPAAR